MTEDELRKEQLVGLKNTVAEEVTVDIGHINALIGPEKAEKLAILVRETQSPRSGITPKMGLPPEKRFVSSGLGRFNRVALINALEGKDTPEPAKAAQPVAPDARVKSPDRPVTPPSAA